MSKGASLQCVSRAASVSLQIDVSDYFGSQKTLVFSERTGSHGQYLNAFNNINDRMHLMSPVMLWISYFRDEGEKLTTNPHVYPAIVDARALQGTRCLQVDICDDCLLPCGQCHDALRQLTRRERRTTADGTSYAMHPCTGIQQVHNGLWPSQQPVIILS